MGLKIGDKTKFYNVKSRKSEIAKITKISAKTKKIPRMASALGKNKTKLRKFIK